MLYLEEVESMKKILTVVLDGWGLRDEVEGNGVLQAVKPNFDKLWSTYPHCTLEASSEYVGLPKGVFGNSEVGHSTIGSGILIKQAELIVNELFEEDRINENEVFKETIKDIKESNKDVHLMFLCSNGGVHSSLNHALFLLNALKKAAVKNVYFHLITDGRDTDAHSSFKYIEQVMNVIKDLGIGSIATICGRYYAMDRDTNWDRTQKYVDLVTRGVGLEIKSIMPAIKACYMKNITDEFLPPLLVNRAGLIKNNDVLFWLNFRIDRAKQILESITNPHFDKFPVLKMPDLHLVTLFSVDKNVKGEELLKETEGTKNPLGIYFANLGLSQARVAETEKFAHVTYFFDNGHPLPKENCNSYLIPSPKVATYDLKPEMSALEVCNKTIECMEKDYDFILTNFANPDMVGHTGKLEATIKAVQVVDLCLGKLISAAEDNFYTIIVLADHGNAEVIIDDEGKVVTSHTTSPVPFIITDTKITELHDGDLTQVAPTILEYMDIAKPDEMKSTISLFNKKPVKKEVQI